MRVQTLVLVGLLLSTTATAPAEHAWQFLFDGATVRGWTGMKGTPFPSGGWVVEQGTLRSRGDGPRRDLVTERKFDSFQFAFDYKVEPGGNSGVKYLVQQEWLSPHWAPDESEAFNAAQVLSAVGYEFQIIDDSRLERRPGWEKESTGALYLLYAPSNKKQNPPGEWNSARVVVDGMHVEHWLNGGKLLEYELTSQRTLDTVEKTKFRRVPGFGRKAPGHIVLTHHGADAWYRNIRIRELH